MKATLRAGQEIDFVSPGELKGLLEEFKSGFARPPQTIHPDFAIQLDSSGNTSKAQESQGVMRVQAGYVVRLHRIGFFPDGSTFGLPFTFAGGYIDILRAGVRVDGISFDPTLNPAGLPQVGTWGTADAIEWRNGDTIGFKIVGGPASKPINIRCQGTLEPIVTQ